LINPGFETGDLTGWNTTLLEGPEWQVVTSHPVIFNAAYEYTPHDGNYFLEIKAGEKAGDANVWQTVSQEVELVAGQIISGWAAFDWGDFSPHFDGAKVEIRGAKGSVSTPFNQDGSSRPDGYNGPWTQWFFEALVDDTYTLEYAARNTVDAAGGSESTFGYFDAPEGVPPIPEPASLVLFGLGLAGLGFVRRRKRQAR